MIRLVPASLLHINPLARRMRAIDQAECRAFGRAPKDALRMSLRTSLHALTALDGEGRPVAMFGVSSASGIEGKGSPWFLGSDEVFRHGRALIVLGPKILAWFHETFPLMENFVSVENVKAIRLLKLWGATIGEPVTIGGVGFVRFRFSSAIQG